MHTTDPTDLDPADREIVDAELDRLRAAPRMRDSQLPGCLLAFLGMLALTLTPALGSWMEIPRGAGVAVFALAVLALFSGAAVALIGSAVQERRARREMEAAADPILAWAESEGDRGEALRAATRLVHWARWSAGGRREAPLPNGDLSRGLGPRGEALARAVAHHVLSR